MIFPTTDHHAFDSRIIFEPKVGNDTEKFLADELCRDSIDAWDAGLLLWSQANGFRSHTNRYALAFAYRLRRWCAD